MASASRVFTTLARFCDAYIPSIAAYSFAAVSCVATWAKVSEVQKLIDGNVVTFPVGGCVLIYSAYKLPEAWITSWHTSYVQAAGLLRFTDSYN
jgi:hypothetical protein